MKPRVHSQPSPTAPVWLSHRKLGFLYSVLSLSHSPCMNTVCVPLPFSLYVSLCFYVFFVYLFLSVFNFAVRLNWSIWFFVSLFFLSCSILTNTHTHTHNPLYFAPRRLSQPADWFSRRGSAGLHKHMALNLPSCVCWNGISFSILPRLSS